MSLLVSLRRFKFSPPANCEVKQTGGSSGVIQTALLKSEIVEGASAGTGNGEVDMLFTPKTGTTLATFEFIGASCILKETKPSVVGSLLALTLTQKAEALAETLDFPAATSEYKVSGGGAGKKAFLTFAGNPATFTGAALACLVSDEKYGAF